MSLRKLGVTMIWPDRDNWRHEYLVALLDENALQLTTDLVEVRKRRIRALRDFVQTPVTPRIGPRLMAELHQAAAHETNDPAWREAHELTVDYYEARADAYLADLDRIAASTPASDWSETRSALADAMWIWENSGRDVAATRQLLRIAFRAFERDPHDTSSGVCFAVRDFASLPANLSALSSESAVEHLLCAAEASMLLAIMTPKRFDEFVDEAVTLIAVACFQHSVDVDHIVGRLEQSTSRVSGHPSFSGWGGMSTGVNDLRDAIERLGESGRGMAVTAESEGLPLVRVNEKWGRWIAQKAIELHEVIRSNPPGRASKTWTPEERCQWLLDALLDDGLQSAINARPAEKRDVDAVVAQTRLALTQVPVDHVYRGFPGTIDRRLDVSVAYWTEKAAAVPRFLARAVEMRSNGPYREGRRQERAEGVATISEAIDADVPRWVLKDLLLAGASAYGLTFARDVAVASAQRRDASADWRWIGDAALDELAGAAASTLDAHVNEPVESGSPHSYADRARRCLLDLVDYPEVTALALERLPFHRLTHSDRDHLRGALNARLEVFDTAFVGEIEEWRTQCVELAFLRALDKAKGVSWWARNSGHAQVED